MKRFSGGGMQIKATESGKYVEGYLVRYTDADRPDLVEEYFSKSTNFMRQGGFPVKGSPLMYNHGMSKDVGSIGIGLIDMVSEDDIGMLVRAKLYERKEYERMIEEINSRKSLGIAPAIIKKKAELAERAIMKNLNEVSHNFSMGAYPPTFEVAGDGHITQCGIVEGSLTVMPAEPNGTEVTTPYSKSIQDAFTLSDVMPIEADVPGRVRGDKDKSKSNHIKGDTQMDMQAIREAIASVLAMLDQSAMGEMDDDKMAPAELEEEMSKAAEDMVKEDEETKKQMDEDEELPEDKKTGKAIIAKWVEANLPEIMTRAMVNRDLKKKGVNDAMRKAMSDRAPQSKRESAGSYRDNGKEEIYVPPQTNKSAKPGLASFIKSAAKHDFGSGANKAQNPYIGDAGGYLLGQELRDEILPPLRANVVAFDAGVQQTNVAAGIGTITLPKMTTAPTAYRPGINTAITESDASFDTVTAFLRPIAAMVTIPFQLLEQSPLAVEQRIKDEMIRSIALQIDIEILNGTGTVVSGTGAQIRGVKTVLEGDTALSSSNIKTLATNGRKPIFSDASAAETQLAIGNIADTEPKSWIMHARSRGRFRDLTATTGEPLFRDNFGIAAYPDLIGYPLHVGNQISIADTVGTSSTASEIYFGAWRYVEYVMQDSLEIIVDRVTKANQLQARIIAYTYSDILVHYPEAFYVMKGVL